jgi:hypothetical protein
MIPTMYLRQVPIYRYVSGLEDVREAMPSGYRLQQWWAKAAFMSGPDTGEGEWRDVEIVDDV